MTCSTWSRLVSQGESLLREASPERDAAELHFASCSECAQKAFLLDPSWALRRPGATGPKGEAGFSSSEIADLEKIVLGGRRLLRIDGAARREVRAVSLAAAALTLSIVVAGAAMFQYTRPFRRPAEPVATAAETTPRSWDAGGPAPQAVGSVLPAAARVYDLGQEDFALVMVVDETLDL